MRSRSPRAVAIGSALFISMSLMLLSFLGILAPAEHVGQVPLTGLQDVFGGFSNSVEGTTKDVSEFRQLRQRNEELELAMADLQAEVAELREKGSDYDRLARLVNYTADKDWNYLAADVIGRDTTGIVRIIHLNRGTRDGVEIGDPVVTEMGLVGRVIKVTANGCEVLLITDQRSSVNARLQSSRDLGLVEGSLNGDLVLNFLDLDAVVVRNDLVLTSGETQDFPADIVIGQVESPSLTEDELFQRAPVRSFVDFRHLEIVLIITNWESVNLQAFEDTTE